MYIQSLGRILQRKMGLSKCHSDQPPPSGTNSVDLADVARMELAESGVNKPAILGLRHRVIQATAAVALSQQYWPSGGGGGGVDSCANDFIVGQPAKCRFEGSFSLRQKDRMRG